MWIELSNDRFQITRVSLVHYSTLEEIFASADQSEPSFSRTNTTTLDYTTYKEQGYSHKRILNLNLGGQNTVVRITIVPKLSGLIYDDCWYPVLACHALKR